MSATLSTTYRPARTVGLIAIIAGLVMLIAGGATWATASAQLRAQNITVAEDASFLAGDTVDGPFSALAQAQIIDEHTLAATEGRTFAEIDREDPVRETAMNGSFLRASLFTSVIAFGVSALVMGAGILIGLLGWAVRGLGAGQTVTVTEPATSRQERELASV